jgi:insertion element IS1 protein InsB
VNEELIDKLLKGKESIDIELCVSAEADEQWSFVQKKKNQYWLWLIIEKESRKVLAFTFGKRTDETYKELISKLPSHLIDKLHSDDWGSYWKIRFTPLHCIGKTGTQRIERKNLDLRTRIKRLTRKTICFSKSELMHSIVIGSFICQNLF